MALESNLVKFAALGAIASGVALYAYNKYCPVAKKPAASCGSCCSKSAKKKRAVEYVSDTSPVVVIDYSDLVSDDVDLSDPIETAFGYDGLGLITVRGVPNFPKLRGELLPLAHKFAMLPESVKAKYEHPSSHYSFGWSHGKEQFEGKPDLAKGSYYNNPLYDKPFDDPEVIKKYASFAHPNIWPTEDLPQLEPAFKNLGSLIIEVGTLLAKHCDRFVKSRASSYPADKLERVIKTGKCVKARLLHYFAVDKPAGGEQKEVDYGSWCGWHNDHGSLTGLALGMYIDKDGKEIPCPDPNAGLYIQSRNGKVVRAAAPTDYMAFQMGETHQVHSGGLLLATPHCVRAATNEASRGVSRESFAVFMEPLWDEPMNVPDGISPEDAKRGTQRNYLPRGVPPLERRWVPTDDFGQFTKKTIDEYTIFN